MSIRSVFLASVCTAFLAASVAVSGSANAAEGNPQIPQIDAANQALASGNSQSAITAYTEAIDQPGISQTDLGSALLNRALAYQQLGRSDQAITDYSSALRLASLTAAQRATAYYNRGLASQGLGDGGAAIDDFTSALYAKPDFPQAYYSRGNMLKASGQHLFALADFEKALRYHHPDPAKVYTAEAQAYQALQRPKDAAAALKLAKAPAGVTSAEAAPVPSQPGGSEANVGAAATSATSSPTPAKTQVVNAASSLPKAVAVPQELQEQSGAGLAAGPTAAEAVAENNAPAVSSATSKKHPQRMAKVHKLYLDRIPPKDEQLASAKPDLARMKVAVVQPASAVDTVTETASIEPAPALGHQSESGAAPVGSTNKARHVVEEVSATDDAETTSKPAKGWSIQLASAANQDAAWGLWKKMQARNKHLSSQKADVVKADLGPKGIFYRVRLQGYDQQGEAQKLCSKIKSGGTSCFVARSG